MISPPRLAAAACAGMFVFGIANALLGAVLPILSARLGFNLAQSGALFAILNFGVLLCVLAVGPLIDRYGMKLSLILGPLGVALALLLVSVSPSYPWLAASVFLLGIAGGSLNAATNTLAADLHPDAARKNAALNLLGMYFGIGALLIPFGVGSLLARTGLEPILIASAIACALIGLYPATLVFPPAKHTGEIPLAHSARFLRDPYVLVTGALLFCQSGTELTLAGYTTTFLIDELHVSVSEASFALTALWVTVTLSRIGLARLSLRYTGHQIVRSSAAIAFAGVAGLLLSRSLPTAAASLIVIGLGFSGIFPTTLGIAAARYQENSGTIFGILLVGSRIGAMSVPYAVGRLGQASTLRSAFLIVLAATFAISVLEHFAHRARGA